MGSTETVVRELEQKRSRFSIGSWLRRIVKTNEFALLMLLLIGVILVTSRNPRFLAPSNIGTLGRDIALIGLLGVGESFTILLGGIDLSIGSVYGLSGVLVAFFSVRP